MQVYIHTLKKTIVISHVTHTRAIRALFHYFITFFQCVILYYCTANKKLSFNNNHLYIWMNISSV